MKSNLLSRMLALLAAATLTLPAARAQSSMPTNTPAPPLLGNAAQILKLSLAKVGDDMILAYIKSTDAGYGLTADQIIYLRQQGLSDPVLMAMLNQPRPAAGVTHLATPAPAVPPEYYAAQPPPAPAAPPVTYVQSVPDTANYAQPYYPPNYFYPADYYYPPDYYNYYPLYGWSSPVTFYLGGGRGWDRGRAGFGGWRGGTIGLGRTGGGTIRTGGTGSRGTSAPRRR
jgi:hypothetical protein